MSENDCVFCKIVRGMVHDEEEVLAFEDISQKALVHVLVVPKQGARLFDGGNGRAPGRRGEASLRVAQRVAEEMGAPESGYAFRMNNSPDAGQEVFHLHSHVMGGKKFGML